MTSSQTMQERAIFKASLRRLLLGKRVGFSFRLTLVRQDSGVANNYCLVYLRNGARSIRSLAEAETFHPVIGPAIEAEALYVRQLRLPERVQATPDEFVIWDIGLGAAANALTAIRLIRESLRGKPACLRLISFDLTSAAAAFALEHGAELGYVAGYESALAELVKKRSVKFSDESLQVEWTLEIGDFPAWLVKTVAAGILPAVESGVPPGGKVVGNTARAENSSASPGGRMPPSTAGGTPAATPPPHAILFDPHSPKKNPGMWTVSLFAGLFRHLDPDRPCALATYTRSTLARVAMLLGGFFVGVGHPSGLKEETTVAANRIELLDEPLDRRWLERARSSHSAEPLNGPFYRQAPLSPEIQEQLQQHPQFT